MNKALALLLSLLIAVSISSAAFADEPDLPSSNGEDDIINATAANIPTATAGQTEQPEASSALAPEVSTPGVVVSSPEASSEESPASLAEASSEESSASESESSVSGQESSSGNEDPGSDGANHENDDTADDIKAEDIPYEPEDKGDLFSIRMTAFNLPVIEPNNIPPPAGNMQISGVATPGGTAWTPVSGIPDFDGAVISSSTKLVFAIPDNNFALSATAGGNFTANLAELNKHISEVKVASGSTDYIGYFNVQFVSIAATGSGRAYGVEFTPKNITSAGLSLPKDTIFGFASQTSPYKLPHGFFIASSGAGNAKAIGIRDGAVLGGSYTWVSKNGSVYYSGLNQIDDVMAGDEFLIHLSPQFFEWKDDVIPAKASLTSIRGRISLRQTGTTSSRIFEAVELTSSKSEAAVRIKFRENLTSTKPIDFKTTIYLAVGGKRHEDSSLDMEGTFGDMEPEEFYSEDREIDISDGIIGIAEENITNVKVYIGGGITLNVPFIRKNAKFYGTVGMDFDKYDEALVEEYPDIIQVYALHTLGLNGAGVKADIDTYNGYFLYDKDLNYLGQSPRGLEYCDKYYLAAAMLDIEPEEEEEAEEEDYPIENDIPPSENPNKNPGTGGYIQ